MTIFIPLGGLTLLVGVAAGAFGAHALQGTLSQQANEVYRTAVHYHLVHGLGVLLVGLLMQLRPGSVLLRWSGACLLAGVLLFSGSLYLLAVTGIGGFGMVTPVGGIAFLCGWGLLVAASLAGRKGESE